MSRFQVVTVAERPDVLDALDAVNTAAWPEFMHHDSVADELFHYLYDTFPTYQVALLDERGAIAGTGNTIPVRWDGTLDDLPDDGWGGILRRGVEGYHGQIVPTTLSALQAVVAPAYKGQGVSRDILLAMRGVAARHDLNALIAPVRPNQKHRYPLTPMERYITWQDADGQLFDAWLRTHQRLGAAVMKVCPRSMDIRGTVAEWEAWTGMRFPETGSYIIPDALFPLEIDGEADSGLYIEPNVWMCHPLI